MGCRLVARRTGRSTSERLAGRVCSTAREVRPIDAVLWLIALATPSFTRSMEGSVGFVWPFLGRSFHCVSSPSAVEHDRLIPPVEWCPLCNRKLDLGVGNCTSIGVCVCVLVKFTVHPKTYPASGDSRRSELLESASFVVNQAFLFIEECSHNVCYCFFNLRWMWNCVCFLKFYADVCGALLSGLHIKFASKFWCEWTLISRRALWADVYH